MSVPQSYLSREGVKTLCEQLKTLLDTKVDSSEYVPASDEEILALFGLTPETEKNK